MSSQPSRRRRGVSFGARAARSGARNGLAICRDSIVGGIDLALGERGRHDGRRLRRDVGDDQLVGRELGARLEQPVAAHAPRDGTAAWSTSSSWISEVSRAAVFARMVATPSRRLSSSERAAVGQGRVGLHAGALFAHQEGDHLELDAVGGAELAALGLGLDLAHLAGEDRDDRAPRRRGATTRASCAAAPSSLARAFARQCRGRHAPPERVCRNAPAVTGRDRRGRRAPAGGVCRHERGTGCRLLRPRALASASCGDVGDEILGLQSSGTAPDSAPERRDDVFGVPLGREVDRRRGDPGVAAQDVRLAELTRCCRPEVDHRSARTADRAAVDGLAGEAGVREARRRSAADWAASTIDTFVARPVSLGAPQEQRMVGMPEVRISSAPTFCVEVIVTPGSFSGPAACECGEHRRRVELLAGGRQLDVVAGRARSRTASA